MESKEDLMSVFESWTELVKRAGRKAKRTAARRLGGRRVEAGRVVWIFGAARVGSTWLASMMGDLEGNAVWNEPLIGAMLGDFHYERASHRANGPGRNYILGQRHDDVWKKAIQVLVLEGAAARFPKTSGHVVIKEPNGSKGAPLLMEALPESKMVLLVRDPRDALASSMDARREGSWRDERRKARSEARGGSKVPKTMTDEDADSFVRSRSRGYLQQMGNAKRAYDAHRGPKVLVRYEDLRAETSGTMRRICAELGVPADERELAEVVEKHSFENIPEDEKGEGKFYRKAKPGGWREDLTPEQVETVEKITAPLLKEFYPESRFRD